MPVQPTPISEPLTALVVGGEQVGHPVVDVIRVFLLDQYEHAEVAHLGTSFGWVMASLYQTTAQVPVKS